MTEIRFPFWPKFDINSDHSSHNPKPFHHTITPPERIPITETSTPFYRSILWLWPAVVHCAHHISVCAYYINFFPIPIRLRWWWWSRSKKRRPCRAPLKSLLFGFAKLEDRTLNVNRLQVLTHTKLRPILYYMIMKLCMLLKLLFEWLHMMYRPFVLLCC